MKAALGTEQETLRQIVRGERPLGDLKLLGIHWQLEGNSCHVDNPRHITISVDIHDLARGLLYYLSQRNALREWALFIYAADDLDLDVEKHPQGEVVLDALWDASFSNPVDATVIETLKKLAP
jgi:hypothetical protein